MPVDQNVPRETKPPAPLACRIVAIANQKGGVGKTTTAVNLTAALATLGYRVLLVDSDPQGNSTSGFGVDKATVAKCLYTVLVDGGDIGESIVRTAIAGLDLIPATMQLAAAELELADIPGRERMLQRQLETLQPWYDYIFIDCPPALSLITINALTAASDVVIPVQAEFYALEGLSQLTAIIERITANLNEALRIAGVVVTMFDGRTRLAVDVVRELEGSFKAPIFATRVPRNVRLSEAPSFGKPIVLFDPKSRGSVAYLELAHEIAAQVPVTNRPLSRGSE